jgi:hypothetical protein
LNSRKIVLATLAAATIVTTGSIATLVSGLYRRDLSLPGRTDIGYGFPLSWHGEARIVYPNMPLASWFSWEAFTVDIVFWSLTFAGLAVVTSKLLQKRV